MPWLQRKLHLRESLNYLSKRYNPEVHCLPRHLQTVAYMDQMLGFSPRQQIDTKSKCNLCLNQTVEFISRLGALTLLPFFHQKSTGHKKNIYIKIVRPCTFSPPNLNPNYDPTHTLQNSPMKQCSQWKPFGSPQLPSHGPTHNRTLLFLSLQILTLIKTLTQYPVHLELP